MLEIIRGFYLWSVLRTFLIVNCQRSSSDSTVCNLCLLPNVVTNLSSTYYYTEFKIELNASLAVNGKYQNHKEGDCAGTNVKRNFTNAWWNISLPGLATIYKVNLLFREKNVRHHGYYVFISESEVDVDDLSFLTPVYHEQNPYPTEQSIIQFPDGIQGQQLYIYLNKSDPVTNDSEYNNNVLDICEVEIWGFMNRTICNGVENNLTYTKGIYNSHIPWKNVTLVCYQRSIQISKISSCSHLNKTCDIRLNVTGPENITFGCSDCPDAPYNSSTTDLDIRTRKQYYFSGDKITYKCKSNHSLVSGNLTRTCLDNGSWSGEQPVCRICTCPCQRLASQNFIKDPIVLKKRIEELKKILVVNRSKLSASIRKKTSSRDDRMSSKGIGMTLGVGVITCIILTIVCSDLLMFFKRRPQK
ncbi:uncharacterized protein LOC111133852 isoform X4 [Crassostrea virginica]|uniref:Uncharacterized protein LOC111131426 n=1 Tax=Crassostrea virginica TaxID=6565 RepID=A0A8B8E5L3_CRAVI|nr:uncharacterized protein LOC111131426 [Crassostrea virginica]